MKITDVMGDTTQDAQAGQAPDAAADQAGNSPDQAQDQGSDQGQGSPTDQSGDQPTPQEQQAYDQVVMAGSKMLYDPKVTPSIMQLLKDGANQPAQAIAKAVLLVMSKLAEAAQQQQQQIPPPVILPAAAEIATLIGELAQKAKLFNVTDAVLQASAQIFVPELAKQYGVNDQDIANLESKYTDQQKQQMNDQQVQAAQQGGAPTPPAAAPADQQQGVAA